MESKYIMSKYSTKPQYNVAQMTEILEVFGVVHNERKTRDLIQKGRINAQLNGAKTDRRAGYIASQKALYDAIIEHCPIMKEIFEAEYVEEKKRKTKAAAQRSKREALKKKKEKVKTDLEETKKIIEG